MNQLQEKLNNYIMYYNEVINLTEKWKSKFSDKQIDNNISTFEHQQFIHVISSIYEVEFKRLLGNDKKYGHKDVILKKGQMDITPIINLTWEFNNGLKHGKIDRNKMHKILNNKCFKKILKYALGNNFDNEVYHLIYCNPILFDFSNFKVSDIESGEIKQKVNSYINKYCDKDLYEKFEFITCYSPIIETYLKSSMYAKDNYQKFNIEEVMSFYRNDIQHLEVIPKYMGELVYYRIIYFYNIVLLNLLKTSQIEFYKKAVNISIEKL